MGALFAKGELAGVRALIVDDDDDLREVVAAWLEACGVSVFTAVSGNEAFTLFQKHHPAILVSDIWMPDGTGCDLVRRIRILPPEEGGLTPAIAVSGTSSAQECFEAGFHFYLAKPFDLLVLLDTIRDFVRCSNLGRAKWTVALEGPQDLRVRFEGHVTAADTRAAVSAVAAILDRSVDGCRVTVDLNKLTGLDPSVGAVGQAVAWSVRHKIRGVVIMGGSWLAQLVARGACLVLGIHCELEGAIDKTVTA